MPEAKVTPEEVERAFFGLLTEGEYPSTTKIRERIGHGGQTRVHNLRTALVERLKKGKVHKQQLGIAEELVPLFQRFVAQATETAGARFEADREAFDAESIRLRRMAGEKRALAKRVIHRCRAAIAAQDRLEETLTISQQAERNLDRELQRVKDEHAQEQREHLRRIDELLEADAARAKQLQRSEERITALEADLRKQAEEAVRRESELKVEHREALRHLRSEAENEIEAANKRAAVAERKAELAAQEAATMQKLASQRRDTWQETHQKLESARETIARLNSDQTDLRNQLTEARADNSALRAALENHIATIATLREAVQTAKAQTKRAPKTQRSKK